MSLYDLSYINRVAVDPSAALAQIAAKRFNAVHTGLRGDVRAGLLILPTLQHLPVLDQTHLGRQRQLGLQSHAALRWDLITHRNRGILSLCREAEIPRRSGQVIANETMSL